MSYQLKVTRGDSYHGEAWKAMEADGAEDWDGDSEGWHYCGHPRGFGSTIQEALENLIDTLNERADEDIQYSWV